MFLSPGDFEIWSRSSNIKLNLKIGIVFMWLKIEGSSSRCYGIITLTNQFCSHDIVTLKLDQGHLVSTLTLGLV